MMRLTQVFTFVTFFALTCLHGVQGIRFVLHNQNTLEGNLDNARFCESLPVSSSNPIYQLKVEDATNPVTYSCTTAEFLYYVEIEPTTGKVFLKTQFDREATSTIIVNLQATDSSGASALQNSFITIEDANDNAPQFSSPSYLTSDYEYPWTRLTLTIDASDRDNAFAGSVSLSLKNSSSSLLTLSTAFSPAILEVKTSAKLDYEASAVYTDTLVATDGGLSSCAPTEPQATESSVTISILDGPDLAPIFRTAPYFESVQENAALNTIVLTVEAVDGDYGLNWAMEYSLIPGSGVEGVFAVDPKTGTITVIGNVDRESPESLDNGGIYRFSVMATEVVPSNNPFTSLGNIDHLPMNANASVTITVLDTNDNIPTFYNSSDANSQAKIDKFTTEMDEETSNFITVPGLSIFVQDLDAGENGDFTLSLSPDDVFEVSPTEVNGQAIATLRVKDSSKLDYEMTKFVVITVSATERTSKIVTSATVNITLNDVNDHSPEFDNVELKANVGEDASNGTAIATFEATDKDSGSYAEIVYDLFDNSGKFGINATTGVVTKEDKLDREITSTYYVTIRATDGGGRFSTASLEITVQDVNDESPIFQRSSYNVLLPENSNTFTSPVLIYASDADEAGSPNSKVTYSIIAGDDFGNFRVEQPSGSQIEGEEKRPLRPFHCETAGSHSGQFEALDDSDRFATKLFALAPIGPPVGVKKSGEIVVDEAVNLEQLNSSKIFCTSGAVGYIDLVLMAEDHGEPSLNNTVKVQITVEDVNDFAPEFNSTEYHANVPEKSSYGTEVFRIEATDGDACAPNNYIDYQISLTDEADTSSNAFFIYTENEGDVGVLQVKDPQLDRDVLPTYRVVIVATDRGEPRKSSSATVVVTLDDVNDKPPVLDATSLNDVEVPEDAAISDDLRTVIATDADSNSELEYGIYLVNCFSALGVKQEENCTDRLEIDSQNQNGFLKVAKELDREHIATFVIKVNVTDLNATANSIPGSQTAYGDLTVRVTDVNDNPPRLEENSGLNVNEGDENAVVGTVSAADADEGKNAEIEYFVAPESTKWVKIDKNSGLIRTSTTDIDRESMGGLLYVTIGARDKGNPSLESSREFAIAINDVNDNDPEFLTSPDAKLDVQENSPFGTFVYQVNATDHDLGINAELKYSLTEGDGVFSIVRDDGSILTAGQLDRETKDQFEIVVKVEDSGGSPRSAELTLTVHVLDEDDNEPKYLQNDKEQDLTVPEGSQDAMVGYVAEASDADLPENGNNYYFIVGGTGTNYFSINITTRELTTSQALDREEKNDYDLVIKATSNELFVPPATPVNWNDVSDDSSMLHVKVNVSDINDNAPVFTETLYETDIPYNTQPDPTSTVIQVQATDADVGDNAIVEYLISSTVWVLNNKPTEVDIFSIVPSRDGTKGDIVLKGAITNNDRGYYLITVQATDGKDDHVGQASVRIGIVQSDETVVLYSRFPPEDFYDKQEAFITELELLLNAQVFVDKVLEHVATSETDQAESDIYIHAKYWNSTELVPKNEVVAELDEVNSIGFLNTYGITGYGQDTIVENKTNDYLTAGLIIVCVAVAVIIIIFCVVIFVMRRNFRRDIAVAKAAQAAAKDILEMKTNGRNTALPNTNNFADGSNPIYDEIGDGRINLNYLTHESNDYDSIDDNAVDGEDSAISIENEDQPIRSDDDQDLDMGAFEIDFTSGQNDNAKLAAALNAARRGNENLTYLFDDVDNDDATFM